MDYSSDYLAAAIVFRSQFVPDGAAEKLARPVSVNALNGISLVF